MSSNTDDSGPAPRWQDIADAGGGEHWVQAELARRDLLDSDADPARLSGAALARFKTRRAEERRVRALLRRQVWDAYRGAHVVHVGADVFYHDTVDIDRYDLPDPDARRADNELPDLRDAARLAAALGLGVAQLRWLCYQRDVDAGSHYVRWQVPKRSGGERTISAPKPTLKRAQRWLLHNVVERLPVHAAAHGFLAGRGTVSNARAHADAALLLKLDLHEFYPSITWRRVKGVFRKAGYNEQVATLLALLCTDAPREALELGGRLRYVALGARALPQGAPTSPALSNTLCLRLDCRLAGLADALGWRYTRYADDLCFSRPAGADDGDARVGVLLRAAGAIIAAENFTLNGKKTRVLRPARRQSVTGLVVNPAAGAPPARVPRALRRRLRAALHNRRRGRSGAETLAQLRGWVAYIHMVDPQAAAPLRAQLDALQEQI